RLFDQTVSNVRSDHFGQLYWNSIPQLTHGFRPGAVEDKLIGKCLKSSGFTNSQVAYPSAWKANRVFTPRNPVVASLERLRWFIEWTSGVARIGTCSRIELMVRNGRTSTLFGIGQVARRITNGSPRFVQE